MKRSQSSALAVRGNRHMLISAFVATCVGFFYRARKARRLEREQAARTEARDGTNL